MPQPPIAESPDSDAYDPLPRGASEARPRWPWLPTRVAALGLGATAVPLIVFVLVGFTLGPQALNVLSTDVLGHFDAVVSVALAALGVFVGLGLGGLHARVTRWALLAATLEVAIVIGVVTGAMYLLFLRWNLQLPVDAAMFAFVLGICACASAASVAANSRPHRRIAARIAALDDVPIILIGGIAVALAGSGTAPFAQMLVGAVAGLAVGVAGWLLFERAQGDAERAVFVTGAIVLLGGLPAFIEASPLVSGLVAALVWVYTPGSADRIIAWDLRKLQHPLVALLLIVAGASIQLSPMLLWIAAPLVLFRLTGKLLASAAAARIVGVPAGLIGTILVPPGVIGIAFALNVQQTLGTGDTVLVSSITVAAVASEVLAVVLLTTGEEAA